MQKCYNIFLLIKEQAIEITDIRESPTQQPHWIIKIHYAKMLQTFFYSIKEQAAWWN